MNNNKTFIEVKHITNLESALNIIQNKKFIPASLDPLNFDACLNCFCSKVIGQRFKNSGVTIYFEWYGETKKINKNDTNSPYNPNILYNQESWKCFIPIGTSNKLLKIVNIIPDDNVVNSDLQKALKYINNNDIYISVG